MKTRDKHCNLRVLTSLSILTAVSGTPSLAWGQADPSIVSGQVPDTGNVAFGIAAFKYTQYAGETDSQALVIPWLIVESPKFFIDTALLIAGVELWRKESFKLELISQARFGFKPENDTLLIGLDGRGHAAEVGPRLQWTASPWILQSGYYSGVGSNTDGGASGFSVSYEYRIGKLQMLPTIDLRWESRALVDHQYGIDINDSTPQRPPYRGRKTLVSTLGIATVLEPDSGYTVIVNLAYQVPGPGIQDSPIVGTKRGLIALFGVLRSF